ncbi:MAG: MAPEG family protein [Alphaproteobacteria bacterium]|jgi:uncharacterized MAPEG superfamily protein
MSDDLFYLTLSAGLCSILWIPYILARIQQQGLTNAVGYMENPPEPLAWAKRAHRVHLNFLENLVPFAALVLVANVAGLANEMSALGAAVFFWARVAHAVSFYAAIPWVRTLAFAVSWVGMVIIFLEIVF